MYHHYADKTKILKKDREKKKFEMLLPLRW